jgi:hypothetical protein
MLIVHCRVFINWVIILEYIFKYIILSTNLALGQMMKINKFKMSYEFLNKFTNYFPLLFHLNFFNQNLEMWLDKFTHVDIQFSIGRNLPTCSNIIVLLVGKKLKFSM